MKHLSKVVAIGKACREWRESVGYTQREIADRIGYTNQMISRFENGLCNNQVILAGYMEMGFDYGKK